MLQNSAKQELIGFDVFLLVHKLKVFLISSSYLPPIPLIFLLLKDYNRNAQKLHININKQMKSQLLLWLLSKNACFSITGDCWALFIDY